MVVREGIMVHIAYMEDERRARETNKFLLILNIKNEKLYIKKTQVIYIEHFKSYISSSLHLRINTPCQQYQH